MRGKNGACHLEESGKSITDGGCQIRGRGWVSQRKRVGQGRE